MNELIPSVVNMTWNVFYWENIIYLYRLLHLKKNLLLRWLFRFQERVETQSGDFNKRKRTGTRCQIENHFPIETTEVFHTIFSIYLISSPYVTASYILLFKHTYKSSTSFIQNNDIIEWILQQTFMGGASIKGV